MRNGSVDRQTVCEPFSTRTRILFGFSVAVLLLFYLFNVGIYFDFTADDPGITFRYGANLFDGHGLVYNHGERVEGYSNFGYVILSGLVYRLLALFGAGRDWLILAMKLLNVAAGAATGVFCYRFCRDTLGRDRVTSLLTVFLLAANGAFVINVSSPLETTLYGTLIMATMYAMSRYLPGSDEGGWGTWPAVATLGAILALWRIDSPLLVAAFGASLLLLRRFRLEKRDWMIFGVWALVFIVYTAFRLAWFGDIVNNPFHTKVKSQLGIVSPFGLVYVTGFFRYLGSNVWMSLIIMSVVLIRAPRKYLLPAVLFVCQWLYITVVNGDWMPAFRFWAVVLPCLCILLTGLLDIPLRFVSAPVERLIKVCLVLMVASYWFTHAQVSYRADGKIPFRFYSDWRNLSSRKLNPYWQTADWLNAHVSKNALIAIQEAGFVPFLTELTAIDAFGLCNRELAHVEGRRNRLGLMPTWDREEPGTRYILSRKPDVIVIGPSSLTHAPQRALGNYLLAATPQARIFIFRREDSLLVH